MGTLRLTGGTLRSRSVRTPSGRAVRPTPARVKEALFSILADRLDNANVLDLFAGTGALGFEALSRGAAHATFVEQHRPTAAALRGTAQALGLTERTTVLALSTERAARMVKGRYDLVFADPPYALAGDDLTAVLATAATRGWLAPGALVIVERASRSEPLCWPDGFSPLQSRRYGEAMLWYATFGVEQRG